MGNMSNEQHPRQDHKNIFLVYYQWILHKHREETRTSPDRLQHAQNYIVHVLKLYNITTILDLNEIKLKKGESSQSKIFLLSRAQ